MTYLFSALGGSYVLSDSFSVVEAISAADASQSEREGTLKGKHKGAQELVFSQLKPSEQEKLMASLRKHTEATALVSAGIPAVKSAIRTSFTPDTHIVQTIKNIDDINNVVNHLAKRLRDWYGYISPEIERYFSDHRVFAQMLVDKSKQELLKQINVEDEKAMGAHVSANHLKPIIALAKQVVALYQFRDEQETILETTMQDICPNLLALCGTMVGAKLMECAGSFRRLALLPASTIQTLGAEKALFRHLVSNARPPKHGVIIQHPLVRNAPPKERGRVARTLANKIAIAVKIDFHGGDPYQGFVLKEELEKRFGGAQ